MLRAIASFFIALFKGMWPEIRKEVREPQEVRQVGGDPETRDAVADSIVEHADKDEHGA